MAKDKQKKHEVAEATAESAKISRKKFEKELAKLQVELTRLQTWVKEKGERVIVVFEGRDTAGKGGVISRITARTSPRIYRHVALPAPSDREKTQVYVQRYVAHFPAAGEIILFDRSWYNRAGVERVMGFCTDEQYERFFHEVNHYEKLLVDDGISLTKFWFSVTPGEQHTRFAIRQIDPVRQWKLSPTDIALLSKWEAYTAAKVTMFERTHTDVAPWTVIRSNDKKRARLEAMRSLLSGLDYDRKDPDVVGQPDPLIVGAPADMREMDPGLLSPTPLARFQLGGPAPG